VKTKAKESRGKSLAMKAGIDSGRKGLVIVAVLWTVVVLMVMVAVLGRKTRLDMKVSHARMEGVRCKWACRAGMEKAAAVLNEDELETDSLMDLWSDNDEDFNDVLLESCRLNIRVVDEASKLNINSATKEQLMGLPDMFEDVADAIIDWRDSNDEPSGVGVEGGYYEGLEFGYRTRNGPFRTIRELLMVKDVTEQLFYGEDTNFNGELDYNERDGDENPPADDGDSELDLGWIAYLTCYTSAGGQNQSNQSQNSQNQSSQDQSSENQGDRNESSEDQSSQNQSSQNQSSQDQNSQNSQNQNSQNSSGQEIAQVNVNTASDVVLAALFGGGEDAERDADSIIAYRETLENGIEDVSKLVQDNVLSSSVFSEIEDYITTKSNIFTIRCFATADRNGADGATLQTEAVVDRSGTPYTMLFWYQGTNN
jgi:type II secretory pathway component PulK